MLRAKYKNSSALTSAHYVGHCCIQLDMFGFNDETMQLLQQGQWYSIQMNCLYNDTQWDFLLKSPTSFNNILQYFLKLLSRIK